MALLIACILLGAAGLSAFDHVSTTTVRSLPYPFGHMLYGGLLIGGVVALLGVYLHGIAGPLVERSGLLALALLCTAYAVTVEGLSPIRGLSFALFMLAFAAANLIRWRQIGRELGEIQAAAVIVAARSEGP